MKLSDLRERVRTHFQQRGSAAAQPVAPAGNGTTVHVHMPGGPKRKVSGAAVAVGALVVVMGLVWSGRQSGKAIDVSRQATVPALTQPASIKGWEKQSPVPQPVESPLDKANAAYAAVQAQQQQELTAAQNRAIQMYPGMVQQPAVGGNGGGSSPPLTPAQQAAEDRRKRDEESLTASSVIAIPELAVAQQPASVSAPSKAESEERGINMIVNPAPVPVADKTRKDCLDAVDGGVKKYALCEGTILPAVLDNRLVGEFAGPVKAFIRRDVFARDGQHILIPRGTVALGDASKVDKSTQKRMEVAFHRLILPDGRGLVLEKMIGLDQAGETALSGKLNRHLIQTFGTAAVIGALSGFSQFGSGSVYIGNGVDTYRQGVASATAQQGQTILQRNLNRPNEITIPEGKVLEIYLSDDLHLPAFVPEEKAQLKERK